MRQFELVQSKKPKRSAFDLSHERKTTLNMGELVPVLCHEILPGDRFIVDFESFLRTLPLISPVMHRVNVYAHAFFVPNRLLLANERWENFITGKVNDTLPSFAHDCFNGNAYTTKVGDLLDHLGYGVAPGLNTDHAVMSQLPIRAYHKIWNDYYRDQNFQTEYDIINLADSLTNAHDVTEFCSLRRRAWEKDYFTSALPSQQRGSVVSLPLGTSAPVYTDGSNLVMAKVAGGGVTAGNTKLSAGAVFQDFNSDPVTVASGLKADLTGATGSSISALRRAFALQRWYEASMRFGQRYVEQLLGLFGIVSKDARLQRAEFISGGKLPVQIGEVLQTSGTDITGQATPQGNMAGRAVSAGSLFSFNREFDEHGWLMIIVSVVPRTSYATLGLRQNFKLDKFDFAFPQLAHLSEQPIYKCELQNVAPTDAQAHEAWGYQPVYTEYRYIPDSVHGEFRDTLGFWSLARDFAYTGGFAGIPALNEDFVECNPRNDIFPVENADNQLLLQSFAKITAIRPLPKFGTPV